jgi:hypothetical protein
MLLRRIVMWFDQRYSSFPYFILNGTIFEKVTEHKMSKVSHLPTDALFITL